MIDITKAGTLNRANHTGTQPIDSVEGLPEALDELNPQNNLEATAAPGVNDDSTAGYSPLSIWIFEGVTYRCVDATPGAAVWIETGIAAEDLGSAAFASTSDFDPAGSAAAAQAFARQRANHTGTQGIETVSGLGDALDERVLVGSVGDESVTTSTGTQTVSEALDRRGICFTALRAPTSGTFDPEDYLETSTQIQEGALCYTLGYNAPGDGGGNDYEIVASSTGTDDGGSFITLSGSGLLAKGLFHGLLCFAPQFNIFPDSGDVSEQCNRFHVFLRTNVRKGFYLHGNHQIDSPVDISGVDIQGGLKGFANSNGTVFVCSGNDGLVQLSTGSSSIVYSINHFQVTGAQTALKMSYATYCKIGNFGVRNSVNGIECGDPNILGTLWNVFERCDVRVSGTALSILGDTFSNANEFRSCYFRGDERAAYADAGGIGAVANAFYNVEFAGPALGLVLGRNKSTMLNNCYFESNGPSIKIEQFTLDLELDGCVYALMRNDNPTGVNSFIWHQAGAARIKIDGGYVELASGAERNNLSLIRSDNPASFRLDCRSFPEEEIYASGWQKFFNFESITPNSKLTYQANYNVDWTAAGTQPDIGSGALIGRYTLEGETCTANIELQYAADTTGGSGQWLFSLPFSSNASGARRQGVAMIIDSGTTRYTGVAQVNPGSGLCAVYVNNLAGVNGGLPMSWSDGDRLYITIAYEIG